MSVAELRQVIAAHLEAELEGWRESGYPYDLFPDPESDAVLHCSFAVGMPSSEAHEPRQRQRLGVTTTVAVRFAYMLTEGLVREYDAALAAERDFLAALLDVKWGGTPVPLLLAGIDRRVDGDGTVLVVEITATVPHTISLHR